MVNTHFGSNFDKNYASQIFFFYPSDLHKSNFRLGVVFRKKAVMLCLPQLGATNSAFSCWGERLDDLNLGS